MIVFSDSYIINKPDGIKFNIPRVSKILVALKHRTETQFTENYVIMRFAGVQLFQLTHLEFLASLIPWDGLGYVAIGC